MAALMIGCGAGGLIERGDVGRCGVRTQRIELARCFRDTEQRPAFDVACCAQISQRKLEYTIKRANDETVDNDALALAAFQT